MKIDINKLQTQHTDAIIGIDPDVEKNGVAFLERTTRKLEITTLGFADTLDYLCFAKRKCETTQQTFTVVIEAGWLNAGNWHFKYSDNKAKVAELGRATGRNHQTGILLAEMCQHLKIPYVLQKPLRKIWKGKDRKITAEELKAFTGVIGRTNQEGRDAALLAWEYAGLPIRITNSGAKR